MAAEISLPLTLLDLLPPKVLRELADAAEKGQGQKVQYSAELADCIHVLFTQRKAPVVQPTRPRAAAAWRKMFLGAIEECHRRRKIGQMGSVRPGVPGALVASTWEGRPRLP